MNAIYLKTELLTSEQIEAAVRFLSATSATVLAALCSLGLENRVNTEAATWQLVSPDEDGRPPLLRVCARCGCWMDVDFCDVCDRTTTPAPAGEGE